MLTDPAVELLALAFAADPLYRWLFADRATRHAALRANFVLAVEAAQHAGHLDRAAGGDAVALWTEPGRALFDDPTPFLDLLEEFAPSRRDQALDAMARCGSLRPADAAVAWTTRRTQRKPTWLVEVSSGSAWRAAGR